MRTSLLIQTTILSLIIIIIFFSYKFFFYENQTKEINILTKTKKNDIEKKEGNLIEDLHNNSRAKNGHIYEIYSHTGELDKKDITILYFNLYYRR